MSRFVNLNEIFISCNAQVLYSGLVLRTFMESSERHMEWCL